ncbi:MAG TPA: hypothetical protein VNU92_10090 [Edaphobacter sp.]|nr:hypothetical protein [Edaphobacter sp.]
MPTHAMGLSGFRRWLTGRYQHILCTFGIGTERAVRVERWAQRSILRSRAWQKKISTRSSMRSRATVCVATARLICDGPGGEIAASCP